MEGDYEQESSDSQSHSEESYGEHSGYHYGDTAETQEGADDNFVNPFAVEYAHGDSTESTDENSSSEYITSEDAFGWESSYVPNPENNNYVNSFGIDEEDASNYSWGDASENSSNFFESFFGDSDADWGWDSADWLSDGGYSNDWFDGGYGDDENFFGSENADGGGWFSHLDPNSPLNMALDDDNSSLSLAMSDPNSMISQALNDPNSYFSRGIDDPNSELGQLLNDPNALATVDFTNPDSFVAKFFGS